MSREVLVTDDWGNVRRLKKCADCNCFEGVHDTGTGPEPYWLPSAVVETWLAGMHTDAA